MDSVLQPLLANGVLGRRFVYHGMDRENGVFDRSNMNDK